MPRGTIDRDHWNHRKSREAFQHKPVIVFCAHFERVFDVVIVEIKFTVQPDMFFETADRLFYAGLEFNAIEAGLTRIVKEWADRLSYLGSEFANGTDLVNL